MLFTPQYVPTTLFKNVGAILALVTACCLLPQEAWAESPDYWIHLAENACICREDYTVQVRTQVIQGSRTDHDEESSTSAGNSAIHREDLPSSPSLLRETVDTFANSDGTGLRRRVLASNARSQTPTPPGESFFILDVGNMLRKMKAKAEWTLKEQDGSVGGRESVLLESSGPKWLVQLWVCTIDGTVLRYDQHLNGKPVASSVLLYASPRKGKYLPSETTTTFTRTGQIIKQIYENYVFSDKGE